MKSNRMNRWFKWGLAIGLGALLALPAAAQEDTLKAFPGYVDFGELNSTSVNRPCRFRSELRC